MDTHLLMACDGKSASQGGLNLEDFRLSLSNVYPGLGIENMKRQDLITFCKSKTELVKGIEIYKDSYFKDPSRLSEQNKKYCRCQMHVAGKVDNPYAVCTSRVGREGNPKCYDEFDFDNIPSDEVKAYMKWKGKI